MKSFDLKPMVEIECPFCGKEYSLDLTENKSIFKECKCGASIEFNLELIVCRAFSKKD